MLRLLVILGGILLVVATVVLGVWLARQPGRFALARIDLDGLVQTKQSTAMEKIRIQGGSNLLRIDPRVVKERLQDLPWVRSVQVRRVFPDALSVQISEKIPVCMGIVDERLVILDEYGQPIKPFEVGDPYRLPVVRPKNKQEAAREIVWMINLLDRFSSIKEIISEAVGFAGKRWVLYTNKGVKLLISENAEQELELLLKLQKKYKILDRKIRQVELRIPGKVAVRQ